MIGDRDRGLRIRGLGLVIGVDIGFWDYYCNWDLGLTLGIRIGIGV